MQQDCSVGVGRIAVNEVEAGRQANFVGLILAGPTRLADQRGHMSSRCVAAGIGKAKGCWVLDASPILELACSCHFNPCVCVCKGEGGLGRKHML